jgi:hypothetical protein
LGEQIVLPEKVRPKLRDPFGILYTGSGRDTVEKFAKDIANPTKLISVGDVTTFHLLESNIVPDICIVDDRTKRRPASEQVLSGIKDAEYKEVSVDNPPGVITEELIDIIEDAINSDQKIRIFVRGEEDLAALPSILMAPINSFVLYGQPNEGVVVVKVTHSKRDEIQDLLNHIIEEQQHKERLNKIRRKIDGYQHYRRQE